MESQNEIMARMAAMYLGAPHRSKAGGVLSHPLSSQRRTTPPLVSHPVIRARPGRRFCPESLATADPVLALKNWRWRLLSCSTYAFAGNSLKCSGSRLGYRETTCGCGACRRRLVRSGGGDGGETLHNPLVAYVEVCLTNLTGVGVYANQVVR